MQFQGEIIVKVQIYSQWMEEVYVPVRVRQFAKAAKLMGKSFEQYAAADDVKADKADEHELVESWLSKALCCNRCRGRCLNTRENTEDSPSRPLKKL